MLKIQIEEFVSEKITLATCIFTYMLLLFIQRPDKAGLIYSRIYCFRTNVDNINKHAEQ